MKGSLVQCWGNRDLVDSVYDISADAQRTIYLYHSPFVCLSSYPYTWFLYDPADQILECSVDRVFELLLYGMLYVGWYRTFLKMLFSISLGKYPLLRTEKFLYRIYCFWSKLYGGRGEGDILSFFVFYGRPPL